MYNSNTDVRPNTLSLIFLTILFSATFAWARPVQIIHTNDLHSHMDMAGSRPTWGGYAAVKVVIDRIRARAEALGIPVLILDGGDFSEGTPFFLADYGVRSWRAMEELGYDAVALGNHDYQVGNDGLEFILKHFSPKHFVLGANYHANQKYPRINKEIRSHAEFVRGGLRIAVMGLTTNELFYRWPAQPEGSVADPILTAKKLVPKLRLKNDFVIALTHLGVKTDRKLVQQVPGVDVVVGGHSHTALFTPEYVFRNKGYTGIVVQAGQHGRYVGNLLLDLEPGFPPRVLTYKLENVIREETGMDPHVQHFVEESRQAVDTRFGHGWLDEVIGHTDLPMDRPNEGTTPWSSIFVKTYRKATHADVALDFGEFYGPSQEAGAITREKLIRYFPRVFNIFNSGGWTIWTMKLPGTAITEMVRLAAKFGGFFNIDGLTFKKTVTKEEEVELSEFRIDGKKVDPFKVYTVATSEGLGRGALSAVFITDALVKPKDSGISIWQAVEAEIRKNQP